MPNIDPLFKSFEDFKNTYNAINTAGKILGGIRIATNPTPLGIAGLLANEVSERLTDKSIPEHVLKYLRENIKPATGSGNVGPDKSGTVIAEGGYFRDPTQRHATAMRAGQYADGGEAEKEYVYGVGPEASGIGRFLSPLLPVRREVIEPYQETFIESPDPGQMERVVTPGQYGEPELAVPQAVQAFLNFKGLARDPEARAAVLEGIAALPGMPEELSRRAQMSAQAAMAGEREVYDPKTGTAVGAEEALLAVPLLNAPGTAASIAMAGDKGGTVLGMLGGTGAKIPSFKPTFFSKIFGRFFGNSEAKGAEQLQKKVDSLIQKGLDGQELWDAQKGQLYRGYYDPSDGQFRIEFDTSTADIKGVKQNFTDFSKKDKEGKFKTKEEKTYGPSARFLQQNKNAKITLDQILDFPEIFEAYPQFKNIRVQQVPLSDTLAGTRGAYDPKTKTMYLPISKDRNDVLSTTLHELQHAIQTEEGFYGGASPTKFLPKGFEEFDEEVRERKKVFEKEINNVLKKRSDSSKTFPYQIEQKILSIFDLEQKQRNLPDILRDLQEIHFLEENGGDLTRKVELRQNVDKKMAGKITGKLSVEEMTKMQRLRFDLDDALNIFDYDLDALLQVVEEVRPILPAYKKATDEYFENLLIFRNATEQYKKTPGEVEARNVQARSARDKLTDPKLRDIYPPDTAEFKPEQMVYPIDPNYRRPYLKIGQHGPEPEGMAMGGGVASMAPVARNMFRGYDDIRRGVGAYAPYIRRA